MHVPPSARHLKPLFAARFGLDIFPLVGTAKVLAQRFRFALAIDDADGPLPFTPFSFSNPNVSRPKSAKT